MRLTLVAIGVLCAGCGDNSRACGEGTNDTDGDGECEPDLAAGGCGLGTHEDPVTRECVPDESVCTGGTVLVNGKCQDPTSELDIDLEEGPEPNAFETGAIPAGLITLEAVGGDGFVIHGCVKPLGNAPDFDVFQLEVMQPTLVRVTADGVGGLAAGFQFTSPIAALASWRRFGISVSTDLARRQVLLPAAGMYRFIVGDSRSLLPQITGGAPPAAGNPDGTSCYYITIDQLTPMPANLDLAVGDTGTIGEDLKLYTASLSGGNVRLTATISSAHAQPSIVVLRNNMLHAFDDDGSITFSGFTTADTPLIAADFVFNYALFAPAYQLTSP